MIMSEHQHRGLALDALARGRSRCRPCRRAAAALETARVNKFSDERT
jgi:hypothetical protein